MTFDAIRSWYTGQAAIAVATFAIPTLEAARDLGCWPTGKSRSVKAALNKQAVAKKFALANDRNWNTDRNLPADQLVGKLVDLALPTDGARSLSTGWKLMHAMMFGRVEDAPKLLPLARQLEPRNASEENALQTATRWCEDFAPVAELVALLDSSRPRRTVVLGTLSPTVADNLSRAMGISIASVRSPEVVTKWVEIEIRGRMVRVQELEILWPDGTKHWRSRYAFGSAAGNEQCHACGHAIRNPWNWVPLLADGKDGPLSLWVGKDCAGKLFGAKVEGDAVYVKGNQSASAGG